MAQPYPLLFTKDWQFLHGRNPPRLGPVVEDADGTAAASSVEAKPWYDLAEDWHVPDLFSVVDNDRLRGHTYSTIGLSVYVCDMCFEEGQRDILRGYYVGKRYPEEEILNKTERYLDTNSQSDPPLPSFFRPGWRMFQTMNPVRAVPNKFQMVKKGLRPTRQDLFESTGERDKA